MRTFYYLSCMSCFFIWSCRDVPTKQQQVQTADSPSAAVRPVHWSYEGESGPENWPTLTPAYALCGNGKQQSPINIDSTHIRLINDYSLNYSSTQLDIAHNEHMEELIDNGHTIQVKTEEGSTFILFGKTYHLKQFHFHTPSEHTFMGIHAPMEIHFVHQADDGSLAVIGVLVKQGLHNPNFDPLIAHLPNKKGDRITHDSVNLNLAFHIPLKMKAYHYVGSLTTPPCSEDVQWLVLEKPISLSSEQIAAFTSRLHNNNRPIQALNNRTVDQDAIANP